VIGIVSGGADLSDCGTYRYTLWRHWKLFPQACVLWLMLNPSIADHTQDDPTIKTCIHFSQLWRYDGMFVGNLYALRSPHPDALKKHQDPVGPDNRRWLQHMTDPEGRLAKVSLVVCAWGNNAPAARVAQVLRQISRPGLRFAHLGLTKSGAPKHPLARGVHRIPREQHPIYFDVQAWMGATRTHNP